MQIIEIENFIDRFTLKGSWFLIETILSQQLDDLFLGCPLNVTAREPNRPHGQMNFPFALLGNSNMEIQIRQVDYLKPDLVRSSCQSKTIQTKDLSGNLDIGRGYVQLICYKKRSGLDKLISKRTSNIRIFVKMLSSILKHIYRSSRLFKFG